MYKIILGLNIDNNKPRALMSIVGPNTKNASNELVVKVEAKERAKNESTVEQIDTTPASNIMAIIELIIP